MRVLLRVIYCGFALIVIAVGSVAWWYVYRPLPQMDGTAALPGLQHEVTVERDRWGVPHIRAASVEDLAEAQGYVMAQDRLWQMDLLRRVARGRLSEILGEKTLAIDKNFRTLGFSRAAERDVGLLDAEERKVYDAYARGVNKFIEQHWKNLPLEFSLLNYKPQPWQPSDTMVIAAYMYKSLTDTWERELNRAKVTERAGAGRAKDLFSEEATMDRFVVGDPNVQNDGSQRTATDPDDEDDDDDMQPDTVLKAGLGPSGGAASSESPADLTSALARSVQGFVEESQSEIRQGLGSNNWVVSGAHTATGKPLLANDTHLELMIPPIWYEIHLTAPGWNVKGITLPGAPMVIIGHNDRIAWGFTNNGADVQDLYIETFNPGAPDEYRANGAWTKAEITDETIHVKGQPDEHLRILVTRHGPLMRREGNKGYALRWTATEPGGLANSYGWLGKARNWKEFRELMKRVWGPGQNVVYADVDGNIGYIMAARVPVRKKGHGEVPVPGDAGEYEWTGYIPFDQLPQALNPESGLIVTANARVVGPNYKSYLTDRWEEPYRTARIYDLLHDRHDLRPEDMMKVQTDTYSFPHVFLADQLSASVRTVKPKDARTQRLIEGLKDWNGIADGNSPEVSFLEGTRRAAIDLLVEPFLGKDASLYQWRSTTFLQKILTDRPSKWLPSAYKSYDELLAAAADIAVSKLAGQSKSERVEDWAWSRFNSLEMFHPIGHEGPLKGFLSITDKPLSGTDYSVRRAMKRHGPAMRFVANPANWDESILLLPAGQSGQFGSSHYADQFSYWYEGRPIFAAFSDAAEANARKHTLTLKPGS
ncbi:MAG TPA: penicillin acylase family protein [Candidatus Udaeobacter sp.]|nr:penicillin acylase family protein [Candidatus Udaeobacter sp.]